MKTAKRTKRTLPRCYKCNQAIRDSEFAKYPDGRTAHLNACPMPSRLAAKPHTENKPGPLETLLGRMRSAPSTVLVCMHCQMCGADASHYLEPAFTPSGEAKILCQDCRIGSAELLERKRREPENTVAAPSGKIITKRQAEARAGLIPESDWIEQEELHQCQNCERTFTADQLREIQDFHERVAPGEEVPSGECPDCGALCHELPAKTT